MSAKPLLNSWKEIASFVGRSERTVQRWEKCYGFPVCRPAGRARSAVIALASEIEAWSARAPKAPSEVALWPHKPTTEELPSVIPEPASAKVLCIDSCPRRQVSTSGPSESYNDSMFAARALHLSEQRFQQVFAGSNVGMYIQTEGLFRYMNPAGLAMLGAENLSQVIGKSFLDRVHADCHAAVKQRARQVMNERRSVPFLEERFLRLNGTAFEVEVTAMPITFQERHGAMVLVHDISDRKREEYKRRAFEKRFFQAQKMEAVGRPTGGVADNFNNLFMVIQGYTELLQATLPVHNQLRRTEQVLKAVGLGSVMTRQLLALACRQIPSPVALDLNTVVAEKAKLLSQVISENIMLLIDLTEALWTIEIEPDWILPILTCFCINSRDAMPHGGTLVISTRNVSIEEESFDNPPHIAPGEYVKLSVTEEQEHAFEPFFATKEIGKEVGLGLAMVYGLVKRTGGHVWVDSQLGQGSCFSVYLPRANGRA